MLMLLDITQSFAHKMAPETKWHRYMELNYVAVIQCYISKSAVRDSNGSGRCDIIAYMVFA